MRKPVTAAKPAAKHTRRSRKMSMGKEAPLFKGLDCLLEQIPELNGEKTQHGEPLMRQVDDKPN